MHSRREFLATSVALGAAAPLLARPQVPAEPKFKLGLVTYNVAMSWDLPTILRICKSVGIAAVECRTTHKHGVEPSLTQAQRADVKKQFQDSGVVFWGSGSVCEFHSPDPAVVNKNVEDCKRFLQLVHDLGGIGVKVRPNGVAKGQTPEQACEQIGQALKRCAPTAADLGVDISVEVHGAVTSLPKHMRKIMDVCDHPSVGVTWNSNNTDLINGSIAEGFELLKKFIKSCHITDLTFDKRGTYPYRDLFRRLASIGYDRYTLCEYSKSFPPEEGERFLKEYKALWSELSGVKG